MALTTAAALKQWIETMGLAVDVSNRVSKTPARRPYITIVDRTPVAPGRLEDGGPGTAVETCFIDVWQDWKTQAASGAVIENQSLAAVLEHNLHGSRPADALGKPIIVGGVPGGAGVIYRVKVVGSQQFWDPTIEDLVHNAITVAVWRQM